MEQIWQVSEILRYHTEALPEVKLVSVGINLTIWVTILVLGNKGQWTYYKMKQLVPIALGGYLL